MIAINSSRENGCYVWGWKWRCGILISECAHRTLDWVISLNIVLGVIHEILGGHKLCFIYKAYLLCCFLLLLSLHNLVSQELICLWCAQWVTAQILQNVENVKHACCIKLSLIAWGIFVTLVNCWAHFPFFLHFRIWGVASLELLLRWCVWGQYYTWL